MDFKINLTAELDNLSVADIISLSALDGLGDIIKNLQKSQKLNIEIPSSTSSKETNFKEVEEEQEVKPVNISIPSLESLTTLANNQRKEATEKYADLIEKVTKELFKLAEEEIVSGNDYIAIDVNEIECLTDEEKSSIKNDHWFNTLYAEALKAKGYRGNVWYNCNDEEKVKLHLSWY